MNDLKFVWRQALAKPLFASLIVGVLALGIGATSAIFSLSDAVLFRSLPVEEPAEVVRVFRVDEAGVPNNNMNFPAYVDLRDGAKSFAQVAAYQDWAPFNLGVMGEEPARVSGAVVSGEFFNLFGVPALLGRTLVPSDDVDRGGHPVAVLSERLWRNRFGADEDVVGREITINTHPFTVVGVMPAGFGGPSLPGTTDAWVPMAMLEQAAPFEKWEFLTQRGTSWHDVIARLAPGVSRAQAQAEVDVIVAGVVADTGRSPDQMRLGLLPASDAAVDAYGYQGTRRNTLLLLSVTATLLLIAMANAASLMLVRTEERSRELALRVGIGATRGRIIRMLLVEALMYASVGTVLGLLVAWMVMSAALPSLTAILGMGSAEPSMLLHGRVLGFAATIAVCASVFAVLSPTLRVLRLDLNSSLKQGAERDPKQGARVRSAMVVGQVALSVGLLVVALLLVRSFWQTAVIAPGFDPQRTLVASVDLLRQGYSPDQATQLQETLVERLRAHPEVDSAAFARIVPVRSGGMRTSFELPDEPAEESICCTDFNVVSPGFFETMRIPLLQGRALEPGDRQGAPAVLVINRAFAEQYLAGQAPLGARVAMLGGERTVVGVVADSKLRSLRESPLPSAWVTLAQRPDAQSEIIIRGRGEDPWTLLPILQEAVRALDPELPIFRTRTLVDQVGNSYREATVMARLLGAFAALAVVLSVAGLYGLLTWQVRTRTREIGIRLAIGASAAAVKRQFLKRGLLLTALGIPLGLLMAAWVARALDELLYGVSAHDPLTYSVVAVGFIALALAATWAPARRSSRVSPMEALRDE
ncbi:MAG: ABC transporter permease [Gammaproteobacteria bacterium]